MTETTPKPIPLEAIEDAINRPAMAALPASWETILKNAKHARIVAIGGKPVRKPA